MKSSTMCFRVGSMFKIFKLVTEEICPSVGVYDTMKDKKDPQHQNRFSLQSIRTHANTFAKIHTAPQHRRWYVGPVSLVVNASISCTLNSISKVMVVRIKRRNASQPLDSPTAPVSPRRRLRRRFRRALGRRCLEHFFYDYFLLHLWSPIPLPMFGCPRATTDKHVIAFPLVLLSLNLFLKK
jgi:hypothetical protein